MLNYKYLIKKAGLTQPKVASLIGVSTRKLNDILNGRNEFKNYEKEKFLEIVNGNSANIAEPSITYNKNNTKNETIRNLTKVALIALENGEVPNNLVKETMKEWNNAQDIIENSNELISILEEINNIHVINGKIRQEIISFLIS